VTPPLLAAGLLALAAGTTPQGGELRFVVLGHIRGSFNGEPHFLLDELVTRVAETEPDLLFLTGDLIFGDLLSTAVDRDAVVADWEVLDRALARTGAEVHRTPGNHDVNDPVTRDVWLERYGPTSGSFRRGGNLFVLLDSTPVPLDEVPVTVPRTREKPTVLRDDQLALLRDALGDGSGHERAFVFVHHTLWWSAGADWWADVHPLLVRGKVRAVFGGDLNPLKFSHVERDGIDYVQTALTREGPGPERLRESELVRLRQTQLDAWPLVTIRGDEVDIEVRTVGAISSGRLTPALHREALLPRPASPPARDRRKPLRDVLVLTGLLAALAAGLALGRWSTKRSA
jgi:hypothetical protein